MPAFMTIAQFCAYAACSRSTLNRVSKTVDGLFVKRGRRTLVDMAVGLRWLASLPRKTNGGSR
jgi:hypothetical protein